MASFKSNFVIFVLIVLYSLMNIDNANCPPTPQEIEDCKTQLKVYCGDELNVSVLHCAKHAITTYKSLDKNNNTDIYSYDIEYFADYVLPNITTAGIEHAPPHSCTSEHHWEKLPAKEFCLSNELINDEGFRSHFQEELEGFHDDELKEFVLLLCTRELLFLKNYHIMNLFIKTTIYPPFSSNIIVQLFLKHYSEQIKMKANVPENGPLSPHQFCQTFQRKAN